MRYEKKPEAVELLYKTKKSLQQIILRLSKDWHRKPAWICRYRPMLFIGGSSGNMKDILKLLLSKNPGIRVVINCIALESVGEAMNCLNVFTI